MTSMSIGFVAGAALVLTAIVNSASGQPPSPILNAPRAGRFKNRPS